MFISWAKQIEVIAVFEIPRYFEHEIEGDIYYAVNCFYDASQDVYGAEVFLRGKSNGHVTV